MVGWFYSAMLEGLTHTVSTRIAASDLKMCLAGNIPLVPYHEYPDGLPETCFTSRQGLETLIRRLVLDSTKYPNIEFITGSVTEYRANPGNPKALDKVIAVSGGETVEFNADLVLGWCNFLAKFRQSSLTKSGFFRLHWFISYRDKDAQERRLWIRRQISQR